VRVARKATCPCGSGRRYELCHGTSRAITPLERGRLQALAEAHDIAGLFPFVRPVGEQIAAHADSAARAATVTEEAVAEGRALLDADERRRLVHCYADRYPDRWTRVVAAVGSADLAERALVTGAVRAAIAERLLPPRGVLEEVERQTAVLDKPAKILLFLLSPENVWSIEDVMSAEQEATRFEPRSSEWLGALDAYARDRVEDDHVDRVRKLARHLAGWLPIDGLPRVSSALAEACEDVRHDCVLAAELAMFALTNFLVRLQAQAPTPLSVN
jgi:SEC-C motif